MWNVMVLTVMMSVAGYYSIVDQKYVQQTQTSEAETLATDMALYRQLVVDYFSKPANSKLENKTVELDDLLKTVELPYWAQKAKMSRWSNYVDSSGTIYIFSQGGLPVNITHAITKASRNSVLVGEAVGDGATTLKLRAPADVPTKKLATAESSKLKAPGSASDFDAYPAIDLPIAKGIRPGSAVWLASRN